MVFPPEGFETPPYSQQTEAPITIPLVIAPAAMPGFVPSIGGVHIRIRLIEVYTIIRDIYLEDEPPTTDEISQPITDGFAITIGNEAGDNIPQYWTWNGTDWIQGTLDDHPGPYVVPLPNAALFNDGAWLTITNDVGSRGYGGASEIQYIQVLSSTSLQGEESALEDIKMMDKGESVTCRVMDGKWYYQSHPLPVKGGSVSA